MTEAKFAYGAGTELVGLRLADCGIDDARLAIVDDLEIPALDDSLIITFQNWKELRGMWLASKASLDAAQQNLAAVETEIRKITPSEAYKAGSAPERKAKLNDIVQADSDYQEAMNRFLTCQWDKDTIETDIENAEKEMAHIKTRLNWRSRIVDFMGTVQPVTTQQMAL